MGGGQKVVTQQVPGELKRNPYIFEAAKKPQNEETPVKVPCDDKTPVKVPCDDETLVKVPCDDETPVKGPCDVVTIQGACIVAFVVIGLITCISMIVMGLVSADCQNIPVVLTVVGVAGALSYLLICSSRILHFFAYDPKPNCRCTFAWKSSYAPCIVFPLIFVFYCSLAAALVGMCCTVSMIYYMEPNHDNISADNYCDKTVYTYTFWMVTVHWALPYIILVCLFAFGIGRSILFYINSFRCTRAKPAKPRYNIHGRAAFLFAWNAIVLPLYIAMIVIGFMHLGCKEKPTYLIVNGLSALYIHMYLFIIYHWSNIKVDNLLRNANYGLLCTICICVSLYWLGTSVVTLGYTFIYRVPELHDALNSTEYNHEDPSAADYCDKTVYKYVSWSLYVQALAGLLLGTPCLFWVAFAIYEILHIYFS